MNKIINIRWLTLEEYKKILIELYGTKSKAQNILSSVKYVVPPFLDKYPDPIVWLNTPVAEKKLFKRFSYCEVEFIIAWYWFNKDFFLNHDYSFNLIEYFASRRMTGNQCLLNGLFILLFC